MAINRARGSSQRPEAAPELIAKYEVRRLLGRGGMGAVYQCFDPLIEREVAVKVLPEKLSENSASLKRFLAEARAVGQLNHPNVIAIYDIGEHEGRNFIVMELAPGGSVGARLEKQGRLPLGEACRITIQAALGLGAAHAAGLVHRDVKPENLMLAADDTVKLVDFGLAKDVERASDLAITGAGQLLGTPLYMSPEQIEAGALDPRTDIYSLGVTLFHLLTGETPFGGRSIARVLLAHVSAARPDPRTLAPDLPTACADLLVKAMAIDPDDRFPTMRDMIMAIEGLHQPSSKTVSVTLSETSEIKPPRPRVLIVEPSKLHAGVAADVFRKAGCNDVVCVTDAASALAVVTDAPFQIAIASRQLADLRGEQALGRIRGASATATPFAVLVTGESPDQLAAAGAIQDDSACVKKQSRPDEILRSVYVSTELRFSDLPFGGDGFRDLRLAVVSKDGSIPADLATWLREFGALDVATRTVEGTVEAPLADRQLVIWLDEASPPEADFAARLIGPVALRMMEAQPTLAIVGRVSSELRLRGVWRPAFLSRCGRSFDREGVKRLLEIAS